MTFFIFSILFIQGLFSQNLSYNNSWALIVGIDDYQNENIDDLNYAVKDAESIREMLIDYYDFPPENITTCLFLCSWTPQCFSRVHRAPWPWRN